VTSPRKEVTVRRNTAGNVSIATPISRSVITYLTHTWYLKNMWRRTETAENSILRTGANKPSVFDFAAQIPHQYSQAQEDPYQLLWNVKANHMLVIPHCR